MNDRTQPVAAMRAALVQGANLAGGWPYYVGHPSRLEPTVWALLALGTGDGGVDPAPHRRFLVESQRPDGLLLEPATRAENRPNFGFNGLAALVLLSSPSLVPAAVTSALVAGLAGSKGVRIDASEVNRQDNAIQGWSWIDGTFSWVEPTAWCTLGLMKASPRSPAVESRLADGCRLLVDRCCAEGGWNYGNSNMLGQDLRPYVPTTALGLLALQGHREEPCVPKSLAFLESRAIAEQSAMALSLALLALRVYGRNAGDVADYLLAQWERTAFLGNHHLTAMALYSLTAGSENGGVFHA